MCKTTPLEDRSLHFLGFWLQNGPEEHPKRRSPGSMPDMLEPRLPAVMSEVPMREGFIDG
jgi:hypothetical protein